MILEMDEKKWSHNMAACINTFLISYADMLATKREALGKSKEEFFAKLEPLYNGKFIKSLEEKISSSHPMRSFGEDGAPIIYISIIDGTRRADEFLSFIREPLREVEIGEDKLDLTEIKGVRVGTKFVDLATNDNNHKAGLRFDVMNRGTTYTTPKDVIALETESYTIFEDENDCLTGHISGSKKDYPLTILMDFAVGKVCDFNRKYTSVDIPEKFQEALKLRDYFVKQAKYYEKMAGQDHYKGKVLPYFVQKPLEDNRFYARHYEDQVKTLEEHLKNIYDPVDVKFENGTFVATLKEKDGSEPGEEN